MDSDLVEEGPGNRSPTLTNVLVGQWEDTQLQAQIQVETAGRGPD